ncbi:SpaA isopeptide-forming pilin-related protein [Bifidobacterium scaligerum]|uniref:Uncharacterized protein n=1 Tax=Bifidobacterium scaligerum TaxID=2052656 RepID=A0A2M9HNN3_9BIFI|nr:SpaA isopeptide-forming pilin-related protein [Bifidobacterium scaligerum]PJM78432.1 hypothetical protein CUU80_09645 [Bifidobacterium scaligerum]
MKMRKLFAGIAAAATLFGGLALGATTAMADDNGTVLDPNDSNNQVNFTFTADDADQWTNREVKYYKLADYVRYYDANNNGATHYGVKTATTVDRAALKTALEKAVEGTTLTVPADANTDLMAWALQNGALDNESSKPWTGSTRNFADSLASNDAVTGDTTNFKTITWPAYGNGTPQDGQQERWITLPAGIYLFVDVAKSNGNSAAGTGAQANNGNIANGTEQNSGNLQDNQNPAGGKVVSQSAPIVIASGVVKDGEIDNPYGPVADSDGVQRNKVEFKNHVTPVQKTFGDKDGTVSTGQTVAYTLTSQLPSYTTGFTNYQFSLTDTPGAGQTVDLSSGLVVKVGDVELDPYDQTNNATGYELKFTGLTQDEQTDKKFSGDNTKQFIIDLSKYVQAQTYSANANLAVTVTYNVTINEDAKTNATVPNTVEVNDNNSKAQDQTSLKLGKFAFTKTDASGNALQGAEFTITGVVTDNTGKTDAAVPSNTDKVATSNDQGVVTFSGLADGVYTVEETKVPDGFLGPKDNAPSSFAAKFNVTISKGKATAFDGIDIYGLAPDLNDPTTDTNNNPNNLTDYKVKNVKNITELPKTGAAGIIMFTVIGALLAGAAGLVFTKSRATKRALRHV